MNKANKAQFDPWLSDLKGLRTYLSGPGHKSGDVS
jgi:hypothetical protein